MINSKVFAHTCERYVHLMGTAEIQQSEHPWLEAYLQQQGLEKAEPDSGMLLELKDECFALNYSIRSSWACEILPAFALRNGIAEAYYVGEPSAQRSAFIEHLARYFGISQIVVFSVQNDDDGVWTYKHQPTSIPFSALHRQLLKKTSVQCSAAIPTQKMNSSCATCFFKKQCFGDTLTLSDVPDVTGEQIERLTADFNRAANHLSNFSSDMTPFFSQEQWSWITAHVPRLANN